MKSMRCGMKHAAGQNRIDETRLVLDKKGGTGYTFGIKSVFDTIEKAQMGTSRRWRKVQKVTGR